MGIIMGIILIIILVLLLICAPCPPGATVSPGDLIPAAESD